LKERTGRSWADDEKIGLFLVREKMVTEAQFNTASDFQRTVGGRVHEVLLRLGFVQDEALKNFFSKYSELVGDDDPPSKPKDSPAESPAEPTIQAPAESPPPVRRIEAQGSESDSAAATLAVSREALAVNLPADEDSADSHIGLILDALLRLLIRKGVLEGEEIKEEIKEEIMRMELEEHAV
jgi:hypothetical protein